MLDFGLAWPRRLLRLASAKRPGGAANIPRHDALRGFAHRHARYLPTRAFRVTSLCCYRCAGGAATYAHCGSADCLLRAALCNASSAFFLGRSTGGAGYHVACVSKAFARLDARQIIAATRAGITNAPPPRCTTCLHAALHLPGAGASFLLSISRRGVGVSGEIRRRPTTGAYLARFARWRRAAYARVRGAVPLRAAQTASRLPALKINCSLSSLLVKHPSVTFGYPLRLLPVPLPAFFRALLASLEERGG
jgi:hypothetical protein